MLTDAEKQIAFLAGAGFTNRQIAQLRNASESTIKNQINAIYRDGSVAVNRNELRMLYRAGRLDGRHGVETPQSARAQS